MKQNTAILVLLVVIALVLVVGLTVALRTLRTAQGPSPEQIHNPGPKLAELCGAYAGNFSHAAFETAWNRTATVESDPQKVINEATAAHDAAFNEAWNRCVREHWPER